MSNITLAGKDVAKVGYIFTYLGAPPECETCQFSKVCHGLKKGYRYRITALRDKEHECSLLDGEKAVVVEFQELNLLTSIPSNRALEGAVLTLKEGPCPMASCEHHRLCRKENPAVGKKVKTVKLMEELSCLRGLRLRKAEVEVHDE